MSDSEQYSSEPEYVNTVGQLHPVTIEAWGQAKEYSQEHDRSDEESLTFDMDDYYETLLEDPIFEVLCDDNPPCSSPDDKYLESWDPCDIFETQLFEEDCYNHKEDEDSQGLGTSDEHSLISDIDGDDLFENPIYDSPTTGVFVQKFVEVQSMMHPTRGVFILRLMKVVKEEQSEFSYD